MCKKLLLAPFFLLSHSVNAQQFYNDSALVSGAAVYAKQFYNQKRASESAIYNGLMHLPYSANIEGTAYLINEKWQKGTVVFDNILYEDIIMKYDLVKDQLIITFNEIETVALSLFSPRVKAFSFAGLKFSYIDKFRYDSSLQEGFYQELTSGNIIAVCKTTKIILETIAGNTLNRQFIEKKKFYFIKNNLPYAVNNKKDLLRILKEHKKEVLELLKEKKLNYRKAPERTIIAATEIYNKLEG